MKLRNIVLLSLFLILLLATAVLVYGFITVEHLNKPLDKNAPQITASSSDIITNPTENITSTPPSPSANCKIQEISDTVSGGSMSGIVEDGQKITVLKNYYSCNEVKRNDVVIYNYAGNPDPLIKIVRAIPGDKWTIKLDSQGYEIIVNGNPLKTSRGEIYQIPTGRIQILKLYSVSYPIIPANTYLILGNLSEGSIDSVRFGLIGKSDIVGKVIINK